MSEEIIWEELTSHDIITNVHGRNLVVEMYEAIEDFAIRYEDNGELDEEANETRIVYLRNVPHIVGVNPHGEFSLRTLET